MSLAETLKGVSRSLKRIPQVVTLSAAILSALAGCTTFTNWEKTSSKWTPTGNQERTVIDTQKEKENSRKFSIEDFSSNYTVGINELKKQDNFKVETYGSRQMFSEIVDEQRTKQFRGSFSAGWLGANLVILGAVALAGGNNSSGSANSGVNNTALTIGLIDLGLLGACGLMDAIFPVNTGIEARIQYSGATKIGDAVVRDGTQRNFLDSQTVYDGAAKNISVKIALAEKGIYARTDEDGQLNLAGFLGNDFFLPGQILSRQQLEKIIREAPITHQIKPGTLDVLLNDLTEGVLRYDFPLTITTDEKPSQGEKVENASKTFVVSSYRLDNDAVYKVVQRFVDSQINSYVKTLIFDVKDITTRVPINGTNFRMISDAPSKEQLAGKYFTDNLMEVAEKEISDYLIGESLQQNCSPRVNFSVYVPSNLSYEVTHPDYKYVTDNFSINGDKKGVIYMVDKGDKIRVEQETNKGGVTEWSK